MSGDQWLPLAGLAHTRSVEPSEAGAVRLKRTGRIKIVESAARRLAV